MILRNHRIAFFGIRKVRTNLTFLENAASARGRATQVVCHQDGEAPSHPGDRTSARTGRFPPVKTGHVPRLPARPACCRSIPFTGQRTGPTSRHPVLPVLQRMTVTDIRKTCGTGPPLSVTRQRPEAVRVSTGRFSHLSRERMDAGLRSACP